MNPLGVPSRMNIGQVLEVHLGYGCQGAWVEDYDPCFDGAHEEDIRECFRMADIVRMVKPSEGWPYRRIF